MSSVAIQEHYNPLNSNHVIMSKLAWKSIGGLAMLTGHISWFVHNEDLSATCYVAF